MLTRTAIRQALHFSLGLGFSEIARLTGGDASSIRKQVLSGSWRTRPAEERAKAITEAQHIAQGGGHPCR